jgi:hypothetical protein
LGNFNAFCFCPFRSFFKRCTVVPHFLWCSWYVPLYLLHLPFTPGCYRSLQMLTVSTGAFPAVDRWLGGVVKRGNCEASVHFTHAHPSITHCHHHSQAATRVYAQTDDQAEGDIDTIIAEDHSFVVAIVLLALLCVIVTTLCEIIDLCIPSPPPFSHSPVTSVTPLMLTSLHFWFYPYILALSYLTNLSTC